MWLVKLALRQRYTVGVLVILLLLFGIRSLQKTSTDILPSIDIPYVKTTIAVNTGLTIEPTFWWSS